MSPFHVGFFVWNSDIFVTTVHPGVFTGQEQILRVVTTAEHPTKAKSLQYKLKFIYESCMALDNIEVDGERPLHKIITNLGKYSSPSI